MVFHDKLTPEGQWNASVTERRYSAEGALLLAHKWSRPDLVQKYVAIFRGSDDEELRRAARIYQEGSEAGTLPAPIDPDHRIGQFVGLLYAEHRFAL